MRKENRVKSKSPHAKPAYGRPESFRMAQSGPTAPDQWVVDLLLRLTMDVGMNLAREPLEKNAFLCGLTMDFWM